MSLPDAAARERALDPERSFIVKAPAGSGKTTLLVARLLVLLARVREPEEVVAITFTRKATAEMRARVLQALADADGPSPVARHARELVRLARPVAARDRELDWQLAANPQRLRIQTVDSLCASLARRLPVQSGLGGALATDEQPLTRYRNAARSTVELLGDRTLGGPVARVLDHVDGDVAALEELLAQMLARRDQWMRYLHMDAPAARRAELEEGLEALVVAGLEAARAAVPRPLADDVVALARFAAARAGELGRVPELTALADAAELPPAAADALPAWKGLAALLLTAGGTLRRKPVAGIFTARGTAAEYRDMVALLAALDAAPGLERALGAVRALPAPAYDETQWRTLLDLFDVLRTAVAALRVEFAASGATDFAEQVAAASQALGEEGEPTDLALALDQRIRHLLVDEFQDTSAAHFDIVRKLTAGWSAGDGHTLFLVGDPMQSIYRFREAEVGLFLGCFRHGLDNVELEPLVLSANFRCEAPLVQWVNEHFASILPAADDPVRGAAAYAPGVATGPEGAPSSVVLHAAVERDARAEAEEVAGIVARTRERAPEQSVAVLLRARAHAALLTRALEARGLRWRGLDLEPLFQLPAVQDLHALTVALLHPMDRASWLALLRAPWCGLSLDDLEALTGDDPRAAVAHRLTDAAALRRLSADGRARLDRAAPVLGAALERVGRDPLSRLATRTWRALGGPACLGAARLEDARRYLRLLAELERDTPAPDPDELTRRASELYAAPAPGAVDVEIMTIHKAKGLEFDVVLLPGLERAPAREARAMLAWSETATAAGPRLLLAPLPPPEGEADSPLHAFVRRVEHEKRCLETARLLYVACTRPRRELHLFASVRWNARAEAPAPPRDGSLLAELWPQIADRFAGPAGPAAETALGPQVALLRRLPLAWTPPPAAPPVGSSRGSPPRRSAAPEVEFSWAGRLARHVGTVTHAALRLIAEDGPAAWSADRVASALGQWRDALAALGVSDPELGRGASAVGDAVRATLADERGRWLLAPHAEARSEYALCGLVGGELVDAVLDRTFVDEHGVRWIVDFKSGRHAGGGLQAFLDREQTRYRAQLECYGELMAQLHPEPVRLALYFPALAGWRDWAYPRRE